MIHLREFTFSDEDYRTLIEIVHAVWPDAYMTEKTRRFHDKIIAKEQRYWKRMFLEQDGKAVGVGVYCEAWWNQSPNEYHLDSAVLSEHQNQGVATAFYDHALKTLLAERTVATIAADTREDKTGGVDFLTHRGFNERARYPRSELDTLAFDAKPYAGLQAKVDSLGIQIVPLSDLRESDPDWQRKMWELQWIVALDEPGPEEPVKKSLEEYVEKTFEDPGFSAESWFIAVDNGHYAGLSALYHPPRDKTKLDQGWTGVDRPYRRKGVATALKLQTIAYAQALNIGRIETDNFESNPMYEINMRLGFRPIPAWVSFQKVLDE